MVVVSADTTFPDTTLPSEAVLASRINSRSCSTCSPVVTLRRSLPRKLARKRGRVPRGLPAMGGRLPMC